MNLLIVESPGKIKKLKKILGIDWVVKASAQKASRVYIATDPDREGEVIAWHLFSILKRSNSNIVRVTFAEITEKAVLTAVSLPRKLNINLVDSGLARLCLDKLVGFRGSPLVWNLGAKSVSRVQSAVLHLLCDREHEIINFKPVDYFSVYTDYAEGFKAYFSHQKGKTLNTTNDENKTESSRVYNESEAKDLVKTAESGGHVIKTIEKKKISKNPPPPFITSSLQQTVGSKLGFSPDRTMKLAQTLYEKGLITYMRTDSVALSSEFCEATRNWLKEKDTNNLLQKATKFKTNKNSQEAHEAIHPSDLTYSSTKLKQEVNEDEFKLYLLIWKRAISSQCASALINKTVVQVESGDVTWKAKGQTVEFLGYAKYWNNLSADSDLPELAQGQTLKLNKAESEKKRTSPPSRYGEPQLVALMEKKAIGRPSTYSSSVKTIKVRKYVTISQKKLVPTELGMLVDSFLNNCFPDLIDAEFTAKMETNLDEIALGERSWQPYLCQWNQTYFSPELRKAKLTIPESPKAKANGTVTLTEFICPVCKKALERYDYINNKKTGKKPLALF